MPQDKPQVRITSFGYLHGLPPQAHLTVDLRAHFRDPHPDLLDLTAASPRVRDKVMATPGIPGLCDAIAAAAAAMTEGPSGEEVLVAVGCAGGKHRAPTVARSVRERLEAAGINAREEHRNIDLPMVVR